MIIVYTFDYYVSRPVSLDYLIISLTTVTRSLTKYRIIIYTTDVLSLTNCLHMIIKNFNIEIRKYIPSLFQHTVHHVNWSRYPDGWNIIGHARVYLIPYLLKEYNQPILYLDCDTGVVLRDSTLSNLCMIQHPIMNADEIQQVAYIYGSEQYFPPQKIDIKISCLKYLTTNQNTYFNTVVPSYIYDLTQTTKNNGILYFPISPDSMSLACEIINVYEHLMNIYPNGFNDLNASSCVFNRCQDTQKYVLSPFRIMINTDIPIDTYGLCHYFTINWLYYGQQTENYGYQHIIESYKHVITTICDNDDIAMSHGDLTPITGSVCSNCINIIESMIFPKQLISIFHPKKNDIVSLSSVIRNNINQQITFHQNTMILSYLTFIFLIQKSIWIDHDLTNYFDPCDRMIDVTSLYNCTIRDYPNFEHIIPLLQQIYRMESVIQFLSYIKTKYPIRMLLSDDSLNYCPKYQTLVDHIKQHDTDYIVKYLSQINPNQSDQSGFNLLHYSIIYDIYPVQHILLMQKTAVKCDVNSKTHDGETALHLAVRNNSLTTVNLLIKFKIDWTITNNDGLTACQLSDKLGHQDMVHLLSTYENRQQHQNRRRCRF